MARVLDHLQKSEEELRLVCLPLLVGLPHDEHQKNRFPDGWRCGGNHELNLQQKRGIQQLKTVMMEIAVAGQDRFSRPSSRVGTGAQTLTKKYCNVLCLRNRTQLPRAFWRDVTSAHDFFLQSLCLGCCAPIEFPAVLARWPANGVGNVPHHCQRSPWSQTSTSRTRSFAVLL